MAGILLGLAYGNVVIAPPNLKIVFSSNAANVDLRSVILAAGWDGTTVITVDVTIPDNVVIFSNTVADYALKVTGSFPAGMVITIFNQGLIVGKGGAGGSGNYYRTPYQIPNPAPAGNPGGPALQVTRALKIDNTGGIIAGGGGGGGAGGVALDFHSGEDSNGSWEFERHGSGSGGGGIGYGAGAIFNGSTAGLNWIRVTPIPGDSGGNGNFTQAGLGGSGRRDSGAGGSGGGYGQAGSSGANSNDNSQSSQITDAPGGAGGAAGACVVGNANITWLATGSRYGSIT